MAVSCEDYCDLLSCEIFSLITQIPVVVLVAKKESTRMMLEDVRFESVGVLHPSWVCEWSLR